MPAIADVKLSLRAEDVVREWTGSRARLNSPRMLARISEILALAKAEDWLRPAAGYRIHEVAVRGFGWMEVRDGSRLQAPLLAHRLATATHLALGVCTIGSTLEQRVSEWFAAGDRLRAVLLDEIGTLALFRLSEQVEQAIRETAAAQGLDASGVLNPGDDGFSLGDQETVLRLVEGAAINVTATQTGMLLPRKSLSIVLGLGAKMPKWSRGESCARCKSRGRCPHRRAISGNLVA